jgi:hypothetical protein
MKLHLQREVSTWIEIDLANLPTRKKKNSCILKCIKDALVEEGRRPNPIRKCAGFYVTLTKIEEARIIKTIKDLYEPLMGKIENDTKLIRILDGIAKSFNSGLRVSRFVDARSKGWMPLFQFNAETWLH